MELSNAPKSLLSHKVRPNNNFSDNSYDTSGYLSDMTTISDKENSTPTTWIMSPDTLISPLRCIGTTAQITTGISAPPVPSMHTNISSNFSDLDLDSTDTSINTSSQSQNRVCGSLHELNKQGLIGILKPDRSVTEHLSSTNAVTNQAVPLILRKMPRSLRTRPRMQRQSLRHAASSRKQSCSSSADEGLPSDISGELSTTTDLLLTPPRRRSKANWQMAGGGTVTSTTKTNFSPSKFFASRSLESSYQAETPRTTRNKSRLTSTPAKSAKAVDLQTPLSASTRSSHYPMDIEASFEAPITECERPKTPTPFKEALQALHRSHGTPQSPSPGHFDSDFAEIMEREGIIFSPRRCTPSDVLLSARRSTLTNGTRLFHTEPDPSSAKNLYISPAETPSKSLQRIDTMLSPNSKSLLLNEAFLMNDSPFGVSAVTGLSSASSSKSGTPSEPNGFQHMAIPIKSSALPVPLPQCPVIAPEHVQLLKHVPSSNSHPPVPQVVSCPAPGARNLKKVLRRSPRHHKQARSQAVSDLKLRSGATYRRAVFEDSKIQKQMSLAARKWVGDNRVKPRQLKL